jgi:hypothetical protein
VKSTSAPTFAEQQWPKLLELVAQSGLEPAQFRYAVIVKGPTGAARKVRVMVEHSRQKRDYRVLDPAWFGEFQSDLLSGVFGKPKPVKEPTESRSIGFKNATISRK